MQWPVCNWSPMYVYIITFFLVDDYESGTWLFLRRIAEEMVPRITRLELQTKILQLVTQTIKEHL